MSGKVVGLVFDSPIQMDPTTKLVLASFAEHAHPDGTHAFPTIGKVARTCCIDRRTAQRHVSKLKAMGLLCEVNSKTGYGTEYRIDLRALGGGGNLPLHEEATSPVPQGGGAGAAGGGGTHDAGGAAPMPPKPSVEPPVQTVSEPTTALASSRSTNDPTLSIDLPPLTTTVVKARRADPLFEALAEACGYDWRQLPNPARGRLNHACKALREIGASPVEVRERARWYGVVFPGAVLTPQALVANWGDCDERHAEMKERSRLDGRPRPGLADAERAAELMAQQDEARRQEEARWDALADKGRALNGS